MTQTRFRGGSSTLATYLPEDKEHKKRPGKKSGSNRATQQTNASGSNRATRQTSVSGVKHHVIAKKKALKWAAAHNIRGSKAYVYRADLVERVAQALLSGSNVVAICAAPGMGKTVLAQHLCNYWMAAGSSCVELCLEDDDVARCLTRLSTLVRTLVSGKRFGTDTLVIVDALPVADEYVCSKIAHSLGRIVQKGYPLLMTMRPECSQLIDYFSDAYCLYSQDLLVSQEELDQWNLSTQEETAHAWQDGRNVQEKKMGQIPAVLAAKRNPHAERTLIDTIIETAFRDTLMSEERALRLSLMLMGSGNLTEASKLVSRAAKLGSPEGNHRSQAHQAQDAAQAYDLQNQRMQELFCSLEHEEPLFGIDTQKATFTCSILTTQASFETYCAFLKRVAKTHGALTLAVCYMLAEAGELNRAAVIAQELLAPPQRHDFVLDWSSELFNSGKPNMLVEALVVDTSIREPGEDCFKLTVVRSLVQLGEGDAQAAQESFSELEFPKTQRETELYAYLHALVVACSYTSRNDGGRNTSGEQDLPAQYAAPERTETTHQLLVYAEAKRLILQGEVYPAYQLILSSGSTLDEDSLDSCMTGLLLHTAEALLDTQSNAQLTYASNSFLDEHGFVQWAEFWQVASQLCRRLVGAKLDTSFLEQSLKQAKKNHHTLMVSMIYLLLGMADMDDGAYLRASVLLEQSLSQGVTRQASALLDCSYLLYVVTQVKLGVEAREIAAFDELAPSIGVHALKEYKLLHALLLNDEIQAEREVKRLRKKPLSPISVQVLRCFAQHELVGLTGLSSLCPSRWLVQITQGLRTFLKADSLQHGGSQKDVQAHKQRAVLKSGALPEKMALPFGADFQQTEVPLPLDIPTILAPSDTKAQVEVHVMGGLMLYRHGRLLANIDWHRNASKMLLMLLAVHEKHSLQRAYICETIWPDHSFEYARKHLYAVVSGLKAALGQTTNGPQYIRSYKGSIALDTECVSCDIDHFQALLNKMLATHADSQQLLEWARTLETDYLSPVICKGTPLEGFFSERQQRLNELYIDAFLNAAETSCKLSLYAQGVRFARIAHATDTLRDDSITVLIKALISAGRVSEARKAYESYAHKLINAVGILPSYELRSLAEKLYQNSAELEPDFLADTGWHNMQVPSKQAAPG